MTGFPKRLFACVVASALAGVPGVALSQTAEEPAGPTSSAPFPSPGDVGGNEADAGVADPAARLDALFAELGAPEAADVSRIEGEIQRLWAQSGSPAMDLLLRRGVKAIQAEDHLAAVEHLSALTEHAPEFAEGWNARATAFYHMDEYALSLADIERTLGLNPRHFGALEGFASIMVELDRPELALRALRAAAAINPHRPSVQEGIARLERMTGAIEL